MGASRLCLQIDGKKNYTSSNTTVPIKTITTQVAATKGSLSMDTQATSYHDVHKQMQKSACY